jgi:hypothetical protein
LPAGSSRRLPRLGVGVAPPRAHRGDHDGAIHALDAALTKAGLPGALNPALRVLDRVDELVAAGRAERDKAQFRLEAANRALLADGPIDVAEYGRVLTELAPCISDDAVGSIGVGDAARQTRMRAVMVVFGMATGLYQQLSDHCRDVVAVIAGIPDPPVDVWQTQSSGEAGTAMIRHGREADWAKFVRLADEWTSIHAAGRLLRETGQFESQLHFDGAPTALGVEFLNWQAAAGGEPLRLQPGPLRVRRAHDLGWVPGLWLKQDHDAATGRRPLAAAVVGEPARVEFA